MDFTPSSLKYVYTAFTSSSGSAFSVNSLVRTSQTDANDFLFAGKAKSLTDGKTTLTFPTGYGYVMKGKTTDTIKNCLYVSSGSSLSLQNACTIPLSTGGFSVIGNDNWGLGVSTFNQPFTVSYTVTSKSLTIFTPPVPNFDFCPSLPVKIADYATVKVNNIWDIFCLSNDIFDFFFLILYNLWALFVWF